MNDIFSRSNWSSPKLGSRTGRPRSPSSSTTRGEHELYGFRIHPLHWGLSVSALNGLRADVALRSMSRDNSDPSKQVFRHAKQLCTYPLPTSAREFAESGQSDSVIRTSFHGSLDKPPCCRALISFAESVLKVFCGDSHLELLRLPLWWADIDNGYHHITGEPIILVQTPSTSLDSLGIGNPSSLTLRICEDEAQCPCHVCKCDISHQEEHWFGGDKVLKLCLQCLPKETIFNTWLFVVNCDEQASVVLDLLGAAGAIRRNFSEHFRIAEEPISHGTHAEIHIASRVSCMPPPIGLRDSQESSSQAVLKILSINGDQNRGVTDVQAMVQKEVRLLSAAQRHPNIVQLHGVFKCERWPPSASNEEELPRWGIFMEYCKNGDMFDAIMRGPLSEEQARLVMRGVFGALSYLQVLAIVHRDVKAENVLVASGGRPVLADFGLGARLFDATEAKRRCGTLGYTAPEILMGIGFTTKVDVFSAGVLLFFMLSSKLPFSGGGNVRLAIKQTLRCVVKFSVSSRLANVSPMCKGFILMCMQREKEDRFCAEAALRDQWITTETLQPRRGAPLRGVCHSSSRGDLLKRCLGQERPFWSGKSSYPSSGVQSGTNSARTSLKFRSTLNSRTTGRTTGKTSGRSTFTDSLEGDSLDGCCSAVLFGSHSEIPEHCEGSIIKTPAPPPDLRPPVDRYRRPFKLDAHQIIKCCDASIATNNAQAASRALLRPGD